MRYWLMAFAASVIVVVGSAVGPLGLLIATLAFCAALFLLWADQLGFGRTWTTFGFDRFETMSSASLSWSQFAAFVQHGDKVAKAATIALVLTALWLIFPEELVLIGVIMAVGWSVRQIYARHQALAPTSANSRPVPTSIGSASPAPTVAVRVEAAPPVAASIAAPAEAIPTQPAASSIALAAANSASTGSTSSKSIALASMARGRMSSTSSLALMARGRFRMQRVRRTSKTPKRQRKSRPAARKATRHVPLHLKLPLGRRQIRRPKRTLRAGSKLISRRG